jgi:hypothetical protein
MVQSRDKAMDFDHLVMAQLSWPTVYRIENHLHSLDY